MSQPVWVLSVDLQTKTATFQSGLADAAKSARGAFSEIKEGAGGMGKEVGYSMFEARHGVMLLGEEFGVHLPRALSSFIASIGPIGSAMEAAFPFLAIAVGATLLIEHLVKLHEEGEKLTASQVHFATAVQTAFNSFDDKILEAEKRADELRNDHLGALKKELVLIDHATMQELVTEFEKVAKAADEVFTNLKVEWYNVGVGSRGAKDALDTFTAQYENLQAKGQSGQATDLLKGTLASAEKILGYQKMLQDIGAHGDKGTDWAITQQQVDDATLAIHKAKVGTTEKEVAAQEALVGALQATLHLESQRDTLTRVDTKNAKTEEGRAGAGERAAQAKEAAESTARIAESQLAAQRAGMGALLDAQRAGVAEREAVELSFAAREQSIKQAAIQGEIAALDKGSKDYQTQLKTLLDKEAELNAQYAAETSEIKDHAATAANEKALRDMETSERQQIEATRQGSAERLAAINAALKQEEALGLQDTSFYRDLQVQRKEAAFQSLVEQGKLQEEAGKEQADADEKAGQLLIASMQKTFELIDSAHHVSDATRVAQETAVANAEYQIKMDGFAKELAALDKYDKEYTNKLKALQDKEKQEVAQHQQDLTNIEEKAQQQRNQRILSAAQHYEGEIAQGLTNVIMRHQTFAQMMTSLGDEVVSGLMKNAIQSVLASDYTKESDAARAARQLFNAGASLPFPINIVAAPVMGAAAFAAVMSYNEGVDAVPGVGKGDSVPAMLTPGEGVVPGGVMDGLRNVASNGGFNQRAANVVHLHPTYNVQTIDGDGMEAALAKHSDQLERHMQRAVRRMNH
jgi:uncharacterized protein Yka (UPF0111/DUF47 family)